MRARSSIGRVRWPFALLAVCVLVAGSICFIWFHRTMPAAGPKVESERRRVEKKASPAPPPGITFSGTTFTITGPNGGVEWEANSDKIEMTPEGRIVKLDGVLVRNLQGKEVILSINAGRAEFRLDEERLLLSGGVSVEGRAGPAGSGPARFSSSEVTCDMKGKSLIARGNVEYDHRATHISAGELECGFDLSRVTARGDVRLTRKG